jgi:hypothetical protein
MNNPPLHTSLETQLQPLARPVARALQTRGIVATLSLWQPLPALALLPFSLHARWPDRIDQFPLSASMTLLPCSGADRHLLEVPLCTPDEAYQARVYARWYRGEMHTSHEYDFYLVDWEEGYHNHRQKLGQYLLGANSYLAVDVVQPEGTIARRPRPFLGRFALRGVRRPSLLIPGRGALSEAALATLASTELAIFNLQRLRGARTRDTLKGVLAIRRRHSLPTLLVASSPNDLFALEDQEIEYAIPLYTIEHTLALQQLHLASVGRDRLQLEQRFRFAVSDLRGYSAALDTALDECEVAWWIARQSLDQTSACAGALPRLMRAQQYLSSVAPADVPLLRSAQELIENALADEACMQERLEQVVACCEEHFTVPASTKTIVLVRSRQEAEYLRQTLSDRWQTSEAELLALGLQVTHTWSEPQACDQLIGSSYLGSRTLDMIFWSGARQATLLLDAIEARAAAAHIARMQAVLQRTPSPQVLGMLTTTLAPALESLAARMPDELVHIPLPTFLQTPIAEQVSSLDIQPGTAAGHDQVLVAFTDGTTVLCAPTQQFDLLEAEGAGRVLQRAATDLEPGDELLIIEQEIHARFSARLMQILDETLLQAERARRDAWFIIVSSTAQGRSRRQLHAGLQKRGVHVDYATVCSWVPRMDRCEQATMPIHWSAFKALAAELQITLAEEALRTYYQTARVWRTQHRKFGRILTRLMRHAASGRLDAETLQDVEQRWGWGVRDLLQATRRCTVDDLVRISATSSLHLAS